MSFFYLRMWEVGMMVSARVVEEPVSRSEI
jgi:hypothetical protein